MSEDMDKRCEQYVQVRDALKRLEEKQAAERKPLTDIQELLSGMMETFLDANKVDSVKTKHGTFYRSVKYSASLADPDVFMRYVRETNKFELLDRRANATAVKQYVQENNQLPPGCNLTGVSRIGVRRKPGSGSTPEGAEE